MTIEKNGDIKSPNNEAKLKAWLAEYSSLRGESIATIGYRVRIVTWGFIGMTLVLSALFGSELPNGLKILFLITTAPLLSKCSLLMWLGEYRRMIRASRHLREIEKKVNVLLQDNVLTWETRLKKEKEGKFRQKFDPYYMATIIILSLAGLTSHMLGLYLLFLTILKSFNLLCAITCILFALEIIMGIEIAFFICYTGHWVNIRQSK